ncbi:serine/threonine-protein kinase KIN2, partial [Rhizopus stolonifer]
LAVKIVPRRVPRKDRKKDENREIRTVREASIMLLLHHPYIVSLKEMLILDPYYYLFMDYVNGGQLLDYIISHGKLKERQSRRFSRQILSALDYCHRNSIVHRDLKIENILISQEGNIKIIDFGLSNLFSPRSSLSTFCGSLYFAAPELLNAKAYTGPEVDVWSFGVVLYVLVCGKVPFDDQSMPALHEKIKRGVIDYPPHLSSECKSILSRMLVPNPAHRATISELMIHPWMNRGYDGPINNHLPDRLPLSLPVNMEVVRQMTGFEFGTEEEIKQKLESIITSEEYQVAAQVLFERTVETHRNHRQNQTASLFTPHSRSFVLPNEDPQSIPAAYHPLVSIYYLVKERLDREQLECERLMEEECTPVASPDMVVHPSDIEGSSGISYHKKGKTHIRVDDEMNVEMDNKRQSIIDIGLSRLFSKSSSTRRSEEEEVPEPPEPENIFRRFSSAFSRSEAKSQRQQVPDITVSTPLQPPAEPKRVKTTTRRMTVGQSPVDEFYQLNHTVVNQVQKTSSTAKGTADEDIKPVFLKGLFSVTTTSIKHPSVIRADLIRVLDRIHVRWREGKGLFECVHMPSIDLKKVDQAVPDLVVRFEIYIVKVPWLLGMHGLQFRRVGGDSWQYKNMCSRILAELKL